MKLTLLLAVALAATPLLLAPTAEAAGYCTDVTTTSCPGTFCKYDSKSRAWSCVDDPIIVCVREPCP